MDKLQEGSSMINLMEKANTLDTDLDSGNSDGIKARVMEKLVEIVLFGFVGYNQENKANNNNQ